MKTIQTGPVFYVYEHWRPDLDVCFYVGKGHGKRAQRLRRGKNKHHGNIVAKLARLGMCVEVRMVRSGLTETEALSGEIERIAFWRGTGIRLANLTDGGEGPTGHRHSAATKAVLSAATSKNRIGKRHSAETRAKISLGRKGKRKGIKNPAHSIRLKGRKHSDAHRASISAGLTGHQHSEETRSKIGDGNRGKVRSIETIEKLRDSHLGNVAAPNTRAKMSASQSKRWENPDLHLAVSSKAKMLWADPEYRAKQAAARKARVKSS